MRKILALLIFIPLIVILAGCDSKKGTWEDGLSEATKPAVIDEKLKAELAANPDKLKKEREQCHRDFREMERNRMAGKAPYDKKLADRCTTIDQAYDDYLDKKYSNK